MEKEKVLFIINPISGAKNKIRIPDLIKKNLNLNKYVFDISYTEHVGHAEGLAKEALKEDYQKIIAVGGDGTVNEIARVLIHTDCVLGIIPSGSGNGLSRHLGLPLNPVEAIKLINKNVIISIDSGSVNGHPFFCTAGVGFDAHIGKLFAESKVRGFNTYVRTTVSEFLSYNPDKYKISIDGQEETVEAFLITFANAAQYGNNAYIAPQADIQDGLLDLCILSPFPKYMIIPLGISLFNKTADQSKFLKIVKSKEVTVERKSKGPVHLDGEPFEMSETLLVKSISGSLRVLMPQ